MSQIEHTLNAEHYDKIDKHHSKWWANESNESDEYKWDDYKIANPLTLTFELPSPWRTDIENGPRDGTQILIKTFDGQVWLVYWSTYGWCDGYKGIAKFQITAWMEIPALPERI